MAIPSLEQKLRSVGIVKWENQLRSKVLRKALTTINKHLQQPNVGVYRREYLLKLRTEFQEQVNASGGIVVLRGGLPSLGKRR